MVAASPPVQGDRPRHAAAATRTPTSLLSGPIPAKLGDLRTLGFARFASNSLTRCVPHGLRYLVTAREFAPGVPAHDFTRDANGDGDTADPGDIAGLALPFCALSRLTLEGLTLEPAFAGDTVAYTASAAHSVTSTSVTATLNNSADGLSITKGADTYTNGDAVPLGVGPNVIAIEVSAADGTTTPHTYSVAVTRAPNTPPVFDEGGTATRSVVENTAANRPIGAPLTAAAADNDTLTYSLDATSEAFGSPDQIAAIPIDRMRGKPMPVTPEGTRVTAETRVRPVRRSGSRELDEVMLDPLEEHRVPSHFAREAYGARDLYESGWQHSDLKMQCARNRDEPPAA